MASCAPAGPGRPLVLGIGNILMGDDGVGVRAVEHMRRAGLTADADLVDGGTAGADLLDVLAGRPTVIIVDAVVCDEAPGTILRLRPGDDLAETGSPVSLHQVGLSETLAMAELLGCAPARVVILGVVAECTGCRIGLTEAVEAAIPHILALVRRELARSVGEAC